MDQLLQTMAAAEGKEQPITKDDIEQEIRRMAAREAREDATRFLSRNVTRFPTSSPGDSAAQWTSRHVTPVPDR